VNLVTNAMKYGEGKPIHVSVHSEEGTGVLRVRDEGLGISASDHERIFQRFERAVTNGAYEGLGLGLYIVRQIVESHGGIISVESAPGEGATFIVRLPLKMSAAASSGLAQDSGKPAPGVTLHASDRRHA
jgi:signal transduction histidine kinase